MFVIYYRSCLPILTELVLHCSIDIYPIIFRSCHDHYLFLCVIYGKLGEVVRALGLVPGLNVTRI